MDVTANIADIETYEAAKYIIDNKATIRDAACKFGLSKSTMHYRLTALKDYNPKLYAELRTVLDENIKIRAVRGGKALWAQRRKDDQNAKN